MKALIIAIGVILGIAVGLFKGLEKPKTLIWKIFVITFISITVIISFFPPIGANFDTASFMFMNIPGKNLDIYAIIKPDRQSYDHSNRNWQIKITDQNNIDAVLLVNNGIVPDELLAQNRVVMNVHFDNNRKMFVYNSTKSVNPILVLPYVPKLEEQIRLLNFHVPVAWVSVLAYLIAMIFSIQYLRSRKIEYDQKASSAASIGTLFAILATITGMIWAKLNWGSFWNWDPRETSIFILLLIYGAYFALRSAIENEEARARLSSVYSIIAFITVPFLIFVMPRILDSLHPGSKSDATSGPVLSGKEGTMNYLQQISFSMGFASFSFIFFWLLNLMIRTKKLFIKSQQF